MDNPLLLIIIIPVSLILGLVFVGDISKTVYTCPKCGKRFRAKWYKYLLSGHYGKGKVLKCPKCKTRQLCVVSYDQIL